MDSPSPPEAFYEKQVAAPATGEWVLEALHEEYEQEPYETTEEVACEPESGNYCKCCDFQPHSHAFAGQIPGN